MDFKPNPNLTHTSNPSMKRFKLYSIRLHSRFSDYPKVYGVKSHLIETVCHFNVNNFPLYSNILNLHIKLLLENKNVHNVRLIEKKLLGSVRTLLE